MGYNGFFIRFKLDGLSFSERQNPSLVGRVSEAFAEFGKWGLRVMASEGLINQQVPESFVVGSFDDSRRDRLRFNESKIYEVLNNTAIGNVYFTKEYYYGFCGD